VSLYFIRNVNKVEGAIPNMRLSKNLEHYSIKFQFQNRGQPDRASCEFYRRLQTELQIPLLFLGDLDSYAMRAYMMCRYGNPVSILVVFKYSFLWNTSCFKF